jgi:Fe-S cluster assembly protein SufD
MNPTVNDHSGIVAKFDSSGLGSLPELRANALEEFNRLGIPGPKHEEYRFTPIGKHFERIVSESDFSVVTDVKQDLSQYFLPDYDANYVILINGRFSERLSRITSPTSEIQIKSLQSAIQENSAAVDEHLAKHVDFSKDAFAAFNTAFWTDGIYIHVTENTKVTKPIFVLHFNDAEAKPVASVSRLLMILERGAQARIVQKFESQGPQAIFSSWVEEIVLHANANLEYTKIQNDKGNLYQVASTVISQHRESLLNTYTLTTNGKMIRNNFGIAIDGEKCESHFYGLYLLNKDTLTDNHTVVDHKQPNSFSNELYKGILDGNSKGIFNGKIYVRPHAQKTNAFQANRNVLLNDTAVLHTKPQLEIWADDVKCSHGCTSGQLDEEALFYLQSRGISREQARGMLLNAFAHEVFETMKDEKLKSFVDQIILDKLNTLLV